MKATDALTDHFRLLETQKKALAKLGILTIRDLLYHFPSRYENIRDIRTVDSAKSGEDVILYGTLSGLKARKAWRSRRPIAEGLLADQTGSIKVMWFNQPYLAKMLGDGALVKAAGRISGEGAKRYLANPEIERVAGLPDVSLFANSEKSADETLFFPIYPERRGITSKWFYHAVKKVLSDQDALPADPLPENLRKKYNLPALSSALVWMHLPKKESDAAAAKKRFSFEEVFFIQLSKQRERALYEAQSSFTIRIPKNEIAAFTGRFPFPPTKAQTRAIDEITKDFAKKHAMSRLLEGDVGSGKTFVAAATAYATVATRPDKDTGDASKGKQDFGNLQVAYMAPTEILAAQHFENFIEYFSHLPVKIGLITGSGCRKFPSKVNPDTWTPISRAQLLKWVANGEIPILFGTHALIQKTVTFKDLAYVIIDEQHRFGTLQRRELIRKDSDKKQRAPHFLSMTATPIPRTLALTIYGDLDLTLLDEMPPGRRHVITEIISPAKRRAMYERAGKELAAGRQMYVICPRIDEPDPDKELALRAASVTAEAKRLKKSIFPDYEIGILHGKMTPKEKERAMDAFSSGDTDILVATSVVEVGVNVPNATVIIIEGAERFGLAQLHQLRGRVLRSTHQAYCFACTETKTKTSLERLKALATAKNGFELAEQDLALRGPGELAGASQWGMSDIGMEALKNIKMVEAARNEARAIVERDPSLKNHADLAAQLPHRTGGLHFE